jgi:hypothetical protein
MTYRFPRSLAKTRQGTGSNSPNEPDEVEEDELVPVASSDETGPIEGVRAEPF